MSDEGRGNSYSNCPTQAPALLQPPHSYLRSLYSSNSQLPSCTVTPRDLFPPDDTRKGARSWLGSWVVSKPESSIWDSFPNGMKLRGIYIQTNSNKLTMLVNTLLAKMTNTKWRKGLHDTSNSYISYHGALT